MSQKTKWVESNGVRYQVVEAAPPEEPERVLAGREDGEIGDLLVDVSTLQPHLQASDGEVLGKTKNGGEGSKWAIVRYSCGAAEGESCGCGCDHSHRATVLGPQRSVTWALARGVKRDELPRELQAAHDEMVV